MFGSCSGICTAFKLSRDVKRKYGGGSIGGRRGANAIVPIDDAADRRTHAGLQAELPSLPRRRHHDEGAYGHACESVERRGQGTQGLAGTGMTWTQANARAGGLYCSTSWRMRKIAVWMPVGVPVSVT
jgi:hypothetical protein